MLPGLVVYIGVVAIQEHKVTPFQRSLTIQCMRAALESFVRKQSAIQASAWRPIAEAPKDGSRIIVAWGDDNSMVVGEAEYSARFNKWYRPMQGIREPEERISVDPIFFQSLPPPPASTKGG